MSNIKKKKVLIINCVTFIIFGVIFVGTVLFIPKSGQSTEIFSQISFISAEEISLKLKESVREEIDNYLKEYSSYYNLDGDKVVEFARSVTNNYETPLSEIYSGNSVNSSTREGQAMMFVYYLNRDSLSKSLGEYGLSSDHFKVSGVMATMGSDQVLRSGLTFSQFLGKVCDNLGMDKNYLLAISYLETGKNTSSLARYSNNFGGLRGRGEYYSYSSPEEGIIAFILNLKSYEKYGLNSIYELSGIYTHGNKYNPSNTWVNSVLRYYDDIVANPGEYF